MLNLDPENRETATPAAAALETLYTETGDVANLVRILRQQAGWTSSAPARKQLLLPGGRARGEVARGHRRRRGHAALAPGARRRRTARRSTPSSGSSRPGAQHRQRIEILRKRIDLASDVGARQELWRRVAGLLERDVGDVEEAIAACVSILDENPEDDQALETLARLYDQQGRHRDRLEILERRLTLHAAAPAQRVALLRQLATLLGGPLGDPGGALGRWTEVLDAGPGTASDPEAVAALEQYLTPSTDAGLRLQAARRWSRSTSAPATGRPIWRRWCGSTSNRRPIRAPGSSS